MKNYIDILEHVIKYGEDSDDRTGTGTIRYPGMMFQHNMALGFPAVTVKKLAWRAVVGELLWFMRGSANNEHLREITYGKNSERRTVWDPNYEKQAIDLGYTDGYLGPIYGKQWRDWGGIDQLKNAVDDIINNPESRRIMVNSWNVKEIDKMALPPCHFNFQFIVCDGKLSLCWSQRSADLGLGIPFNIASYGLLLCIVAKITGTVPNRLIGFIGDAHIYNDHLDMIQTMVTRDPKPLPELKIMKDIQSLSDIIHMTPDDFVLERYVCHPAIKAKMSA